MFMTCFTDTFQISGMPDDESSTDPTQYLEIAGLPDTDSSTDPYESASMPSNHYVSGKLTLLTIKGHASWQK